jgi:hypothetical protein
MSEKVQKVLSRLGNIWQKRLDDDGILEWFEEYETALRSYETWVLDAATTRIIQTRKTPGFPLPREVIDACVQVMADDRLSKPRMKVSHDEQHQDPYKLADTLIDCELGRQAARAEPCWVLALHDFCRENRRLPAMGEIERCKRVAADFEMKYRLCLMGNAGAFSKPLLKLAETMIKRREALRARLLGREAA